MVVEEIDARDVVEEVQDEAWKRPTDARRSRVEPEPGPVSYGQPAPSLRSLVNGFQRWARQYWWLLTLAGITSGSVLVNRLWELLGVATKADLDRTKVELYAALDGGANDSEARKALDGGAHDHVAREGIAQGISVAASNAREAWLAARRAAALAGVDAGALELDAGTTVTGER